MSDMLQNGVAWLQGTLKASVSQTVSYARGAQAVKVQATLGQNLLKLSEDYDSRLERTDADFLIAWEDLDTEFAAVGLTFGTPQRGDQITLGSQVYQVLAPGKEPPWRWSDPWETLLRIHGTRIQ